MITADAAVGERKFVFTRITPQNERRKRMPHHRRALVNLMAVLALCVVLGVAATPVHAGVLAPKNASDMRVVGGADLNGHVPPCPAGAPFLANFDEGSGQPFTIPAGEVFVLISADWRVVGATPGTSVNFILTGGNGPILWHDSAFADANGNGGDSSPIGGVVLKSGASICWGVQGTPSYTDFHGFFAKDK